MNNIERFNRNAALILGTLYRSFPVPIELNCADFDDPVSFQSAVLFLRDSDFLKIGIVAEAFQGVAHFFGVSLTMLGLSVLNSTNGNSDETGTLGARITALLEDDMRTAESKELNLVIGELIKYGMTRN